MVLLNNMKGKTKKLWVSTYLFYADPMDDFLISAIYPFVKETLKIKLAIHYFFIRYWKRGPHIRLRFMVNSLVEGNLLKNKIKTCFENYFALNPSIRDNSVYSKNIKKNLVTNNSIRFISYKPEIERYGGLYGVQIAEKLFEASSDAVLNIIKDAKEWNYDRAIGAAMEMHMILLYVFHSQIKDSIKLLEKINPNTHKKTREGKDVFKNKLLIEYEKNFIAQKKTLIPYMKNLLLRLSNHDLEIKPWMAEWFKSAVKIHSALENSLKQNLLTITKPNLPYANIYWPLLASYIHMTNNRLGIKTSDEPYIAFLLRRTLESI